MRRGTIPVKSIVLSALALCAVLAGCALRPVTGTVTATENEVVWTQSTASDFKSGTLERVQIQSADDGELTLAQVSPDTYEKNGTYVSPPFHLSQPFSAAIWKWDVEIPAGTTLTLAIRTSADGEAWSGWQDAAPDDDLWTEDGDWPGHIWIVQEARALQYRLQFATNNVGSTPVVAAVTWTFTDVRPGPDVHEAMQMVIPQSTGPGVRRPAIIPRRGWGANEDFMTWPPEYQTPQQIIIHHTATPKTGQDPAAMVRAIYYYHAVTRGWGDIGYNYLIDPLGNIYEGRAGGENVIGGHARGFNGGTIGIALIGDYQQEHPTDAMMQALADLVTWLCDRYHIAPLESATLHDVLLPNLAAHRDTKPTTCPGDHVYARLPALRQAVQENILQASPSVRFLSPEAGAVLSAETIVRAQGGLAIADTTLYLDNVPVTRTVGAELEFAWDTQTVADGDHQLKVVARNERGEEASETIMVLVDNTAPHATLVINGGREYATQKTVTVTVDAFDVGSGLESMQLVRGDDPSLAPVQDYQQTVSFVLGDEPGPQVFAVRVMDKAGHASSTSLSQIFYDPVPPSGWSEPAWGDGGVVSVQVGDGESGLNLSSASVITSTDGGFTWGVWTPAQVTAGDATTATLATSIGAEVTTVRFQIADEAGNIAQSPPYFTACDDCQPPETSPTPTPAPVTGSPDLLIAELEVFPPAPQQDEPVLFRVRVRNGGDGSADGFWVQLYLDPGSEPYVNSISTDLGTGIFWYVEGLAPGEEIVLSSSEPYQPYSNYQGHLASGLHKVYVLADAYHTEGTTGIVPESDESNNMYGPVTLEVPGSSPFSWSSLEEWLSRWLNWEP